MSDYLNHQRNKQGSGIKFSLSILAVVAVCAVIWVIFFADDGTDEDFAAVEEPAQTEEASTVADPGAPVTSAIVPSFDVVRISRNGTGVIAGRAAPNSDVTIYARDKQIGTAIADRNGEWVLLFDDPLPSGPTELSIIARTGGDFEIASSDIVIVAVPDRNEERFTNDETDGVVAILTPRTGNGPSRVLQKPQNVNMLSAAKGLSLDALDYTENGKTVINGSAVAGASVRIYLDNQYMGEVQSDEEGSWRFELTDTLTFEEHVIRLDQILDDGNVEVRISQPFNPLSELDRERATGDVIVKPGNSLWHIARKLYGSGYHYTVIFGANRDLIVDPDLIFPGQELTLPLDQLEMD
ncbi:LysM peptidoglycan-binding domain-containing protein [Pseudemcibacter aquimaris]|uniref:LysM peptidoglycan-binding domain-containing protein n=1 Tax=Pseudemcibacter aquimaris TaxID=2857064 RepID=UPI0020117E87|nr:LysM peptidoglycan-binding domain-containing protein [Pseudemcibacter aquimaris]MCC3860837.1 LysM peptidoglycan-binding domain-containing protein [Pseudemcibacter aquimaris]WDU59656.1 LysM peptidoglycan-binding domain-containing protein [Pseudemcibacter aquimaris]